MSKTIRRTLPPKPEPAKIVDRTAEFKTFARFADALTAMQRTHEACIMISLGIRGLAVVNMADVGTIKGMGYLYAKCEGWHKPVPLNHDAKAMFAHALKYTTKMLSDETVENTPPAKLKKRPLKKRKA